MATATAPDVGKALVEAAGAPALIVTRGGRVYGAAGTLLVGPVEGGCVTLLTLKGVPAYPVPVSTIQVVTVFLTGDAPAMKVGRR